MVQGKTSNSTEEANVNHKNFIVMWNRLNAFAKEKGINPEDVNIFQDLPFSKEAQEKYKSPLDFYTDEDEWSTLDTYVEGYMRTKEITGNPNEFRISGRSAAKYKSWGQWDTWKTAVNGPVAGINYLPSIVPNWNKTKIFDLIEPAKYIHMKRKVEAIIKYQFYPNINPSSDYCSDPHILGLLEAMPENWFLPQGEARQVLAQYDPIELFSGRFFSHLNLEPVVEDNDLFLRIEGTHKKVGEKVILRPTKIHGTEFYVGDSININDKNQDNHPTSVRILETVKINDESVCEEGMILNAPYFVINYSCKQVGMLRTLWYLGNFFTGNRELINQQVQTNKRLQEEIATRKNYEQNLEKLVDERTSELRTAYETLKDTQKELVKQEVAKAQRDTELKLEKSLSGGLAHEARNSLQPAAFKIQSLAKYDSGMPSVESFSTLITRFDDLVGNLAESIYAMAEKANVPESLLDDLVLPKLVEINSLYKQIEEAKNKISSESGEILQALPTLKNSIGKGLVLAQQFLDYSKMQDIKRGQNNVDLVSLVTNTLDSLQNTGISYKVHTDNQDYNLRGDYVQLESVVRNLVNNSRDALKVAKEKNIDVYLSRYNKDGSEHIRVLVEDTGEGIAAEKQEKVFTPFFSTKPSTGTGLGLSFVKRIVEAYGGNIQFESKEGLGTKFYVDLPVLESK